jgi:exosortase
LLGAAFYPSLVWLVTTWLGSPYYGHGILVPLVSIVLAWRTESALSAESQVARASPLPIGLGLAVLGAVAHWLSLRARLYSVSLTGLVLVIAGLVWLWEGRSTLRRHAFSLAFLLLAVPIPRIEALTPPLARTVARYAAVLARGVGIPATVDGARVTLTRTTLAVGAPCSGLSSLVALATLAALYAYLVRGPIVARLVLVALSVPTALGANLVRVLLLLVAAHLGAADVASGPIHALSSPLMYLVALMVLVLCGKVLRCSGLRFDI